MARPRTYAGNPGENYVTSIYMPPVLRKGLDPNGGNISLRILQIVQRYAEITRHHTPVMAEGEWLAIIDAARDHRTMLDPVGGPAMLWIAVRERALELQERWEINADRLAYRLRDMDCATQVAIAEVVWRFKHQSTPPPESDPTDLLRSAGARIAG